MGEVAEGGIADVAWARLTDQLEWYDTKSVGAQRAYKRLKLAQLVVAATVPVVAAFHFSSGLTATLAALVVVGEGAQQLFQWHTNWLLYRSTAEALKHEKYLYLASVGEYSNSHKAAVLLERVEAIVSNEHRRWTTSREGSNERGQTIEETEG
ncbi:DUF4231 domain-containing protein [Nocardia sp. BMG51109]|uniref:DUF4231 domain-containing protein n=1 Tax=Nocardia sp. BMG51109 TaxID=1056816 RepID=UPI00046413EE|nr:DUF4231 domain-containing protein [Nocardia sp. BMG51109]